MAGIREQAVALLNEVKMTGEASAKVDLLKTLMELVLYRDPLSLLPEFVPYLMEFQTEPGSPIRKYLAEMIEGIGMKHVDFVPVIVPVLLSLLQDATPAVARRAITSGSNIFRSVLEQVALQGVYSGQVERRLVDCWNWMTCFKDAVFSLAFQHGNDGVRLLALKFVETTILLFTPDPNGLLPNQQSSDGTSRGFNMTWIAGGHPVLDATVLGQEASKNLGLLLNQLRTPEASTLPCLVAIVIINSLAGIAKKRPSMFGRILPVLLALAPNCEPIQGSQIASVIHELKSAFLNLLKSNQPGALPWRDRLVAALRSMNVGDIADQTIRHLERAVRVAERNRTAKDTRVSTKERISPFVSTPQVSTIQVIAPAPVDMSLRKRSLPQENGNVQSIDFNEVSGKRSRHDVAPITTQGEATPVIPNGTGNVMGNTAAYGDHSVAPLISAFATLLAQGERGAASVQILIESLTPDMLAEIVIANMVHLPSTPPFTPEVNFGANWGLGPIPPSGPPEIPVNPVTSLPIESAPALQPYSSTADLSQDLRKDPRRLDPRPAVPSDGVTVLLTPKLEVEEPKQEPIELENRVVSDPSLPSSPPPQSGVSTVPVPSPVITLLPLSAEQQAALSTASLVRIMENHKTIAAAGGADLRIALLARLVAQSYEDTEVLKVLQKHVLADYQAHKGHELVLHVLYQLFAEHACSDVEQPMSTSLAYEQFLLSLAQGLRDKISAGDRSLSRLLGEAPVVPMSTLKLVEELCNPPSGAESSKGEHVTAGLTALWSLILQRPPTRDTCLKMALKCTVHESDDTRAKAIRLVANKLYPLKFVAQNIEDFATASLLSVVDHQSGDTAERDILEGDNTVKTDLMNEDQRVANGVAPMDVAGDEGAQQPTTAAKNTEVLSLSEAQRCMSLFFALCTKKHALLRQLFQVYGRSSKVVKQAVHRHIPILFRTIGSSSQELLQLIADPPAGSENLLLQVLHSLTDGTEPSEELIATVKKLYDVKFQDATYLIPVLSSLSKDEVTPIFPRLVDLSNEKFQAALARILQGSAHTGPALTPAEVLISLHGIDPHRDSVPLKKVMDACATCLQQRTVFTQQVLAKVLNQLVEQTPLPLLFMRTVIQAVHSFPSLESFVMEILSRLVSKQIWKLPKLWTGFLKCAHQTKPKSFHVLLQLPTAQLEDALKGFPSLKEPLAAHADQPSVRPTVPRSSLVLLGLCQDTPAASNSTSAGQESNTEVSKQ
uniref:Symplekin n=1 Tax=Physcomitrium patens TaxID=3218 RepID=A0A7I4D0A7_PHYPA